MAQQVEHVLGKDEVTGSSPVSSSTNIPARRIKIRRAGFSFVGRVFRSSDGFFVRRAGFSLSRKPYLLKNFEFFNLIIVIFLF